MASVEHRLQAASRHLAVRAAFGKRLEGFRGQAGLSLIELSERTGLPAQRIKKAEKGRLDPRLSMIEALAEALGIPPPALIENLIPRGENLPGDRVP